MPEDYEPEVSASDDLLTPPNGDESNPNLEQPNGDETDVVEDAPIVDVVPPVVPVDVVPDAPKPSTPRQHPGDVSPFATGLMTEQERAEAAELFLPEQVAFLERFQARVAERTVQAYEQQQDQAAALGVPPGYMKDVKAYSHRVPEHMRGTKEGAEAAVLLAMHERAGSGGSLIDEMEKFVREARPSPTPPPAPKPKTPIQPIHPTAQPTRSSISGGAVAQPQRNGKQTPLERHFAYAKED